jgi:hypothetical protein
LKDSISRGETNYQWIRWKKCVIPMQINQHSCYGQFDSPNNDKHYFRFHSIVHSK